MTAASSNSRLRAQVMALSLYLPENVRLFLARFSLWRKRRAAWLKTTMLAACLVLVSTSFGTLLLTPAYHQHADEGPALRAAPPEAQKNPAASLPHWLGARQWGELQAEILRLRMLFNRIVEASDFDGEEFALTVKLADDRYLYSLSPLEEASAPALQHFVLAKRSVDHMTTQAEIMLSISRQRQQERRFTLSGSPVVRAQITSLFGYRIDPRSGLKRLHRGLDFGGATGSKVLALADGVVTYSGKNGGYGNLVELEHTNGFRTRYAHNESNLVEMGSKVDKGQVIATMGSTGRSTGTHVHVEVRSGGKAVDPLRFISAGS